MTIADIIKLVQGGSYLSVLVLYGFLGYRLGIKVLKLADKWADKAVTALSDCAKAFGTLTRAIDGGRETPPATAPPSTRATPLPKEKK